MIYYVYILECDSGKYYTGYTADIKKRVKQHVTGKGGAKFTRGFRPRNLLAVWQLSGTRGDAMRVEALVKSKTRVEKTALVRDPSMMIEILMEKFPEKEFSAEVFSFDEKISGIYNFR